jgi:hypothetical protein
VHSIAPQIGHFVRLFEDDFTTVEVVRYPLFQNVGPARKAVVAKGRRARVDGRRADVIWHPSPEPVVEEEQDEPEPVEAPVVEPEPVVEPVAEEPVVGGLDDDVDDAEVPPGPGEVPYTALPSGVLARELGRRFAPWNPRFWRGVQRKIRTRRR